MRNMKKSKKKAAKKSVCSLANSVAIENAAANSGSNAINIRRDAIEKFKKQQKASEITEDDYKIAEKDVQKLTDDYIKELDKIAEKKEKELLEI